MVRSVLKGEETLDAVLLWIQFMVELARDRKRRRDQIDQGCNDTRSVYGSFSIGCIWIVNVDL